MIDKRGKTTNQLIPKLKTLQWTSMTLIAKNNRNSSKLLCCRRILSSQPMVFLR